MNKHLSKYGNNTITRFDIVGSFFVNLFYNEFYKKSNNIKQQRLDKSTTDIYVELLSSYSDFTDREEFFKQAVNGIHAYVISNTNQIDMTHKECIDFIVKEFIPDNIFNNLRENQKAKIFHDSIKTTVKIFISKIVSRYIKLVIDNRHSPESSTILQNEFLDIICIEKDKIYGKFIAPKSSNNIPVEIHKKKLTDLLNILNQKDKELHKKESLIQGLKKVNEKSSEIIKQLQKQLQKLSKEVEIQKLSKEAEERILPKTNTPTETYKKENINLTTHTNLFNRASSNSSISEDSDISISSNSSLEKVSNKKLDRLEKNISKSLENNEDVNGESLLYDTGDDYY